MQHDITKKKKSEQTVKERLIINIYDLASVLVSSVITIAIIFTFILRIVGVQGTSMLPTLNPDDWVLVSAFDSKPQYGQVVIITQPNYFNEPIVKRIIATENQVVDIDFNKGEVYVDGVLLDEPYINNLTTNYEGIDFPLTVKPGHVFVMGDNRQGSTDSRSEKVDQIQEEYIMGVVKYKFMSFDTSTGKYKFNSFKDWKVE